MMQHTDNVRAFIIHLERARAREPHVELLKSALPVVSEIVMAVDAQELSCDEVARFYHRHIYRPTYPFILSQNEIACFLSHRKIWALIAKQDCDAGLILEDDAGLDAGFTKSFVLACDFIKKYHFIRLPHRMRETGSVLAERDGVRLILPQPVGLGQVAYLVSRQGAVQLLEMTQIFDRPIDVFLQMFWLTKLRPLSILPSGIREISAQIGGSTLHQKRTIGGKCRREILRPLYRWRLALACKKHAHFMNILEG